MSIDAIIHFSTSPSGAIIYEGTTELGISPPSGYLTINIAPGYYQFRAVKEGYRREIYEVTLEPGEERTINLNLVPSYQIIPPYFKYGLLGISILGIGYLVYKKLR